MDAEELSSGHFLLSTQQNSNIIHIRPGSPGHYQSVHQLKRMIGVVVLQHLIHIHPQLFQLAYRASVHNSPGRVGGAVGSV